MHTTFYLKGVPKEILISNPSTTKRTIYIYYRCKDGQFRKTTKLHIRECDWVEKDKRGTVQRVNQKITGSSEINYILDEWQSKADKFIRDKKSNSEPVFVRQLEELFTEKTDPKPENDKYELFTFLKEFITYQSKSSRGHLNALLLHLTAFNDKKSYGLTWENLDERFYKLYCNFLAFEYDNQKGGKGVFNSVIANDISNIQRVAKKVSAYVQVNNEVFKFEEPKSITKRNYITEDELENRLLVLNIETLSIRELHDTAVVKHKKDSYNYNQMKIWLEKARDCYVFGFETGLRFSDLQKLLPGNLINVLDDDNKLIPAISFLQTKTKNEVMIPLTNRAQNIVTKWMGSQFSLLPIPKKLDTYLKYLKQLFNLAGFTELVNITRLKGDKEITETVPRWKVLTSHTSRHGSAQDLLDKTDDLSLVAGLLGHTSLKPTKAYTVNNKKKFVKKILNAKNKPDDSQLLKVI